MSGKRGKDEDTRTLPEKIIDELAKTGFPTEIIAARTIENNDWKTILNPLYIDPRQKISREYDIWAHRSWSCTKGSDTFWVTVHLMIECKKSDHPWVFFTTARPADVFGGSIRIKRQELKNLSPRVNEVLYGAERATSGIAHHYYTGSPVARTYYEPFKGQEKNDRSQMIYKAAMSSTNAVNYHLSQPSSAGYINLYYPVIIFDGNLFEARVNIDKTIDLSEIDHMLLLHEHLDPEAEEDENTLPRLLLMGERYMIDVVRADALPLFLKLVTDEHGPIAERAQRALEDGTWQGLDMSKLLDFLQDRLKKPEADQ